MIRKLILIIFLVLLLISSSGCINIYWIKDLFGVKEKKPVMVEKRVASLNHSFELAEILLEDSCTFEIKNGTEWLDFDIDIVMIPLNITLPPGLPIPPWIIENISKIKRHVNITIILPDATVFWQNEYNVSQSERFRIDNPIEGRWRVEVVASGVGYEGVYQDSYSIIVRVRELEVR